MYGSLQYPSARITFGSAVDKTKDITNQTVVTTGAANTKGSWTTLETATAYEARGFWLTLVGASSASAAQRMLVDVYFGTGTEEAMMPNILVSSGGIVTSDTTTTGNYIYVPAFVPVGSVVKVRAQCNNAGISLYAAAMFDYIGETTLPVFSRCDTFGADTSTTSGVSVSSGYTGYGSYTSIGTANREYQALGISVGVNAANYNSFVSCEVAINRGSDVFAFRRGFAASDKLAIGCINNVLPHYTNVLSGDLLRVRIYVSPEVSSPTPVPTYDVVLHGYY